MEQENNSTNELIVCAAIKFDVRGPFNRKLNIRGDDWILPMVRHYSKDAHETLNKLDEYYTADEVEQGFITNLGRFVDRKEALEIAKKNNQIKFSIGYEPDALYSEMLY